MNLVKKPRNLSFLMKEKFCKGKFFLKWKPSQLKAIRVSVLFILSFLLIFYLFLLALSSSVRAMEDLRDTSRYDLESRIQLKTPALKDREQRWLFEPDVVWQGQQGLRNLIVQRTGAVPDHFRVLKDALKAFDEPFFDQLTYPEDVLGIPPQERKTVAQHPLSEDKLRPFTEILDRGSAVFSLLHVNFKNPLRGILQIYEDYVTQLKRQDLSPEEREELITPKVSLTGDHLHFYRIPQTVARKLISKDSYGFTTRQNQDGLHHVSSHEGVHYKLHPLDPEDENSLVPGMEYAMYAFYQLFAGQGVTPTMLLSLKGIELLELPREHPLHKGFVFSLTSQLPGAKKSSEDLFRDNPAYHSLRSSAQKKTVSAILQASQSVGAEDFMAFLERFQSSNNASSSSGAPLNYDAVPVLTDKGVASTPSFVSASSHPLPAIARMSDIDPFNLGVLTLGSLFTLQEDGKPANYRISSQHPYQITGVDNDVAFVYPVFGNNSRHYNALKSIFFCLLEPMKSVVHDKLRRILLSLSPDLFVLEWTQALETQNKRYQALQDDESLTASSMKILGLPQKFTPETAPGLQAALAKTQKVLLRSHPTYVDIFRELQPLSFGLYAQTLKKTSNPLAAYESIHNGGVALEEVLGVQSFAQHDRSGNAYETNRTEEPLSMTFPLTDSSLVSLSFASLSSRHLRELHIWGTEGVTDAGHLALSELFQRNTTLRVASLSKLSIPPLLVGFLGNQSLRELLLQEVDLGSNKEYSLFNILRQHPTLEKLGITRSRFSDSLSLGPLAFSSTLRVLDLSHNELEDLHFLSTVLKVSTGIGTGIVSLDLYYNKLNDQSAIQLAEALTVNKTLASLNLENNTIGPEGVKALCKSLHPQGPNKTLKRLSLKRNRSLDPAVQTLLELLPLSRLEEVNLQRNRLTEDNEAKLKAAAKKAGKKVVL